MDWDGAEGRDIVIKEIVYRSFSGLGLAHVPEFSNCYCLIEKKKRGFYLEKYIYYISWSLESITPVHGEKKIELL